LVSERLRKPVTFEGGTALPSPLVMPWACCPGHPRLTHRHSGAVRSTEPGISRFRVWSFRPRLLDRKRSRHAPPEPGHRHGDHRAAGDTEGARGLEPARDCGDVLDCNSQSRSARSQAGADLPIGARSGLRHHSGIAREQCPSSSAVARHFGIRYRSQIGRNLDEPVKLLN